MAKLANCNISFHTNDDDKDWDTELTVIVYDEDKKVAARISNNFGKFPNDSNNGPFSLTIYNQSSIDKLQKGSVDIKISPNGNDTWKFNFFLDLQFDDGSRLSGGADGLVLTQNNRSQSFGLTGIVNHENKKAIPAPAAESKPNTLLSNLFNNLAQRSSLTPSSSKSASSIPKPGSN